jgi:glycerol uptake facilitator-like aquaporin
MNKSLLTQKLIAEGLGTFLLTLAVLVSLNNRSFPIPTPLVAATTLGLMVLVIGKVSGCHINPAVTTALAFLRKITPTEAALYIFVQIIGALSANIIANIFIRNMTPLPVETTVVTILEEALGAFVLGLGVGAVVYHRVIGDIAGPVIGASLFIGITIAAYGSNAILNPAVAIGVYSAGIPYLLGPVIGTLCGMIIAQYLATNK